MQQHQATMKLKKTEAVDSDSDVEEISADAGPMPNFQPPTVV